MSTNKIFIGALGLCYIDVFCVQHFAGRWEAAVFASLLALSAGVLVAASRQFIK